MALTAGSIAFTGFNGDGNDNLSFVALADIPQGTVINFTDNNWNGTSFAITESIMAWTATTAISAGTVVNINNIGSGTLGASAGTVSFTNASNTGVSNDSEVVYAYIGSASSPTFLAAISNVGYSTTDGTLSGTGLVAGQTAVSFTGGLDIMGYNGPRSGQASFAAYLAALNNTANWQTQNGSGSQAADGTAPDAPFPTTVFSVTAPAGQTISFSPASVSVAEGNSGTKAMTFTVVRSGGTTGAVNFSGSFAAGSTNANDYGGTTPASTFSGTIAAGATSAVITITISGDTVGEANESFTLTLTSATNASAAVTIGTAGATGTITNDDGIVISSNSSTAITLANNDQASILSGVTLSGTTPVTWVGGSTTPGSVLNNSGTISGSSRAIYTSGSTSGSFTVNNATGATITAVKDAIKISNLGAGASGVLTIDNLGTIRSTGIADDAGQALDLDDVASANVQTVINNWASGIIQAADADAIRAGTNATINNYGLIDSNNGSAASTGNDAIDFQAAHTGGVINNYFGGAIVGARHGITGDQPITVNNRGSITGEAGAGINMDSAGTTTTVITNTASGVITGNSVGGADGDGVDVDGKVAIDNYGTIRAVGLAAAANGLNEALAIGGGAVHNRAGGQIVSDQRAITVDDSNGGSAFGAISIINEGTIQGGNGEAISITGAFADTVTNSGVITGSIATAGGADTLTNSGTITGSVALGDGDDTLNLVTGATITGTRDGGLGTDTVNLSGTGAGALGATTGFENLVAQEGTWSVAATDYANVTIENGATVTSAVALNSDDHLTIEAGGKLTGAISRAGSGNIVVDNAGLVEVSGRVLNAASSTGTLILNNLAGATIRQVGSDTDVIRPGQNATVNNYGTITTAPGFAGGGDLIDFQTSTGGKVNNYAGGWMEGSRHAVTGDNAVTVVNDGTMIGRNGSAVNIDNGGTEAEKVFVTNRGTMEGRSAALADSDGDAVDVDGLAQILNYGRIAGLGANGRHDGEPNVSEGIAIGGGTILNYGVNAEIYGYGRAIQVDNSSNSNALGTTFINNEGLIKGDGHGPEGVTLTPAEVATFDLRGNEAVKLVGDYADEIINGSTGRFVGGVSMGGGNDHLQSLGSFTATGGSAIDMGAGNDTMYLYTGTTVQGTILLGEGDDLVLSTADSGFVIDAGDGDDQMYISGYTGGNDTLSGGAGDDTIYAGLGNDQIDGGADDDTLSGEAGDDVIDGGAGDDHLMGGIGADTLRGGEGDDRIEAGADDIVEGGADNDMIEVSTWNGAPASIDGGDGDDTVKLLGTGTGALGAAIAVENLVVQEGTWSVADGAEGYSNIVIDDGATVTSEILLGDGDHLTVEQGGKLVLPESTDGSLVTATRWTGGNVTIDNAGTIGLGEYDKVAVASNTTGTFTFNNAATGVTNGSIEFGALGAGSVVTVNNAGLMDGGIGYAIKLSDVGKLANVTVNNLAGGVLTNSQANYDIVRGATNMVLNNAGIIQSPADADAVDNPGFFANGGDAVDYNSNAGGVVHNLAGGLIEGSRHAITGKKGITVTNDAGATLIGRNGSGINFDNDATVANTVHVINRGTILGKSAGYEDSDGDAIDADGLVNVLNYGRIAGLGANGYHDSEPNVSEAIAVGGGTILNYGVNAEIHGYGRGIQVDNSSNSNALGTTFINNEGLIKGDGHGPEGVDPADAARFDLRGNEAVNLVGDFADEIINGSTGRFVGGVSMGGGNDHLQSLGSFTATGGSAIDMGAGNDTMYLYTGTTVQGTILLGEGDDLVLSTADSGFVIEGGDGDDQMYISGYTGGNDTLSGGAGDDTIYAGLGNDQIDGGADDDTLSGEAGDDVIDGGAGDDHLMGGIGADTLRGGEGDDRIEAGADDIVEGGADNDMIEVSTWNGAPASIDGGDGDDTVKLLGTGTGALGAAIAVENLVVQEGTWSVADGAEGYSNIVIKDGATVTSAIQLYNADTLKIEQGGSLTAAVTFQNSEDSATDVLALDNAGTISLANGTAVALQLSSPDTQVTLWNREGGVIQSGVASNKIGVINVGAVPAIAPTADVEINNAGLIASGGVAIYGNLFGGDEFIVNNLATGVIRGGASGAAVLGWIDVLNNAGRIEGGVDGFSYDRNPNATFNNLAGGHIEGRRHAVTGKGGARINNAEGATMVGNNGSAVNIDNDGVPEQMVYVNNHGTMEGRSAELIDSDGDAIDVDGLAQVLNYGRIAGLGAEGYHNGEPNVSEGIAIGGGTIVNNATGEIYGYGRAIQVDNSENGPAFAATIIVNDGLIQGDGHGPEGVDPEDAARFDLRGNEAINFVGDWADEVINGSTGRIVGGVSMGGGNDHLQSLGSFTATGGSAIDMGAGNDTVYFYTGTTVQGTVLLGTGDDLVLSTADSGFVIDAGDGNDQMYISGYTGGNDTLSGGAGDDVIYAGLGNDQIDGGADNDTLSGEAGDDVIDGGAGDDHIMGGIGADTLRGGEGDDRIEAGAGDTVEGGADNDTIEIATSTGVPALINGGDGVDTLELSGTGSGGLAGAFNIEKLVVESGTWTVLDASNFSEATVESGATLIAYGNGTDTTVAQGATHYVWGTAAASVVSGQQIVGPGASASETTIASGGEQIVHTGAVSNGAIVAGKQSVFGSADQTAVNDGGLQAVYAGGTASGTTVNAGGTQIDWGTVSDTIVNGGTQYVWGTANGTTVNAGLQLVGDGGTANAAIINAGGEQIVYTGGVANGAFLGGGDQTVYGSADQTTIDDGGLQSVYGSVTGTMVEAGGEQNVHVNGVATGTTLNGGVQIAWGSAVDTTILSGNQYVWGSASGTTIQSGAQHVGAGGNASDTVIDSGGLSYVHTGGTLHDVTFDGAGGTLVLDEAEAFSGEISGWEDGDSLGLGNIDFGASTTLAYVANAENTGGTLTVSDGSHVATLELLGQYTAADFAMSSNGYGGTIISDPGVAQQNVLAPALAA